MATFSTKILKKVGIYKFARTSSDKVGDYKKNTTVIVTQEMTDMSGNKWDRTDKGWFMAYNQSKKQNNTDGLKRKDIGSSVNGSTSSIGNKKDNKDSKKDQKQKENDEWKETQNKFKNLKKMMQAEVTDGKLKTNMQLFGIPYQFTKYVDCKVEDISEIYGRKYAKNFIIDAPVVTIMPGKPTYLPGEKDKESFTQALLEAGSGNLAAMTQLIEDNDEGTMRLYDFKTAYIEYMKYVNVLCRTCAAFLELDTNCVEGYKKYQVNGDFPDLMTFDWKDYRWDGKAYGSSVSKAVSGAVDRAVETTESAFKEALKAGQCFIDWLDGIKEDKKSGSSSGTKLSTDDSSGYMSDEEESLLESMGKKVHYVQFYCDPTATNYSESLSNATQQSQFKGALDNVSSTVKEVAFLTNTGGMEAEKLQTMGDNLLKSLGESLGDVATKIDSGAGSLVKRLFTYGSNVIQGDNIIMPDIYSSTSRSASITITIPLKPMYGNKYSYYFDYLVPLMHLIALAFPKATSANTYSAPFLVKAFMRGVFNCNLGMVTSISLQHEDTYNSDGLYMGGTVTLEIQDLYPDVAMTPANDPIMFVNNSSLIEYLATNCGLNLIESQFQTKLDMLINNLRAVPADLVDSAIGTVGEKIDDLVYEWTGL